MAKISQLPLVAAPDGHEQVIVLKDGIAQRTDMTGLLSGATQAITDQVTATLTDLEAVIGADIPGPDWIERLFDSDGRLVRGHTLDGTMLAKLAVGTAANGLVSRMQPDGFYALELGSTPGLLPAGDGSIGTPVNNPDVAFYILSAEGCVLAELTPSGKQAITTALADLTDVDLTGAVAGQLLGKDSTGKWRPVESIKEISLPLAINQGGTGVTTNVLSRMQRSALVAEKINIVRTLVNPALSTITSPASAPSFTGMTDWLTLASGFVASFTGSTTSNSPIITGVSSISGLTIGQPLVENGATSAFPTGIAPGAVIAAIDSTAMTVTMDRNSYGAASGITIFAASQLIDIEGGVAAQYGGTFTVSGSTAGNSVNPPTAPRWGYTPFAVEFMTDAANLTTTAAGIILQFYNGGVSPNVFRVAVDDVYQTHDPVAFGASGSCWATIQFAAPGVHKVRIEVSAGSTLRAIYASNGASIWKPNTAGQPRVAMFGDSYFVNGASGSFGPRNIAHTCGKLVGWKTDMVALGGTGYTNSGGTNYNWQSPYRIADLKRRAYDAIVFWGSVNDSGAGASLQAAALSVWQQARALYPQAPIIIFGMPTTINLTAASASTLEGYLKAAFTAFNDPNSWFIPVTGDVNGNWTTPANASTIIAADGTHLSDGVGTDYFADKMAEWIRAILNSTAF